MSHSLDHLLINKEEFARLSIPEQEKLLQERWDALDKVFDEIAAEIEQLQKDKEERNKKFHAEADEIEAMMVHADEKLTEITVETTVLTAYCSSIADRVASDGIIDSTSSRLHRHYNGGRKNNGNPKSKDLQ